MSGPKQPVQQNEEQEARSHNKPGATMPMPKMPKGMGMPAGQPHMKPPKGNK